MRSSLVCSVTAIVLSLTATAATSAGAQAKPASAAVSTKAPDSAATALWDSVTAPANLLRDPPGVAGSVVRDLVYVRFRPGTTQSDRQAAIDLVHGRVVGGMVFGEGEQFYAVRIPYVLLLGDSTSGPILRAQAALRRLPTTTHVLLGYMDKMRPNYRLRP